MAMAKRRRIRKKLTPIKKGVICLCVVAVGFLGYDIYQNGWPPTAQDEVVSIVDENGELIEGTVPEPQQESSGVYGSVDIQSEGSDLGTYYGDYKLERQKTRSEEMAILQDIIDNDDSAAEELAAAQQMQITIAERMEQELMIENLLAAKSFKDSVAFIQNDRVTVVLSAEMTDDDMRQIADIAQGVTGTAVENVIIIKKVS